MEGESRQARRAREREERKAQKRDDTFRSLLGDMHCRVRTMVDHPLHQRLVELSRALIAAYEGVDDSSNLEDAT